MYRKCNSSKPVEPKMGPSISISKPKNSRDCDVMFNRVTQYNSDIQEEIQNYQKSLDIINTEIAKWQKLIEEKQLNASKIRAGMSQMNETLTQNNVNLEALSEWSQSFKHEQKVSEYTDRCTKFIHDYLKENDELPFDSIDFLGLNSPNPNELTSDEICKLAHYIHATNTIKTLKSTFLHNSLEIILMYYDTYKELYDTSNYPANFFHRYCGELNHVDTYIPEDKDEDENGNKIGYSRQRSAWCLVEFEDITLDTKDILFYDRVY
jgi:hypothetical protein